jgi:hypothetical protein
MSRWDEFLKIAASIELKWPKLREVMVAQSIMESGRCTTELSTKHLNPFGMHYVNFNESLCTKVQYYTDSEPVQDDGKRWGWFAQYPSYENAIRGWENWFLKWEHYQAIWKNNPEYLQDPEKFLYAISPHYCPPGMRPEWAKIHGGLNYPQYILQKLLPEAKALLKSITPTSYKTLKQGDRGEDVLQLQKELNARIGSFLVCDGIYGQKTYEAVKKAEANLGLVEDGVADPIFREKLQTLKPLESKPSEILPWPTDGVIPLAKQYTKRMRTRGAYQGGNASGVLLHHSASKPGTGIIDYGIEEGYAYLCLDRDGTLWQAHDIREWGYHAGESSWKGLTGGVTDDLIGIEVVSAGRLTRVNDKLYPWWAFDQKTGRLIHPNELIPEERCVYCPHTDNDEYEGWYQKITSAQEQMILQIVPWLLQRCSKKILVSHYEVAPKRKNDIMGMSMTMTQLREKIRKDFGISVIP